MMIVSVMLVWIRFVSVECCLGVLFVVVSVVCVWFVCNSDVLIVSVMMSDMML